MTQLRAEILVGQRYRFLQRLGTDQVTETWKAFDTRLGRPVALRLLSEHERENARAEADLRAAARARTTSVDRQDPSAPRVLDGGEDPLYGPFVVSELGSDEVGSPVPVRGSSDLTQPPLAVRSAEVTRPLPTLDPAAGAPGVAASTGAPGVAARAGAEPAGPPAGFFMAPERGRLGLMVLIGVILVVVAAFVLAARLLAPADPSTAAAAVRATVQPPSRPLSGAPAAPNPTIAPVATAAQAPPALQAQATPQPSSRPTSAPTDQPTPQTSAQSPPTDQPTAQPTPQPAAQPTPRPSAQPTPQGIAQLTPQARAPLTLPPGAQTTPQASAQPTPLAQATSTAAQQSPPPQGSPADTIRQHYAFIDAKRYAEGYALMDAHLRRLNSTADYQSWFVDKISVKAISIDVASQTDTEAVVHSVVDTTDRVDGQSVTNRVSEEFVLHPENGAWRIDEVSRL